MPLKPEQSPALSKSRGPEPLRRKRAEPPAAFNGNRRRIVNLLLVFATVVLLVDALVGEKGLMERMRASREYALASRTLGTMRAENARIRQDIQRLREDPGALEAIARQELGLIKPGELLFIVRDVTPTSDR